MQEVDALLADVGADAGPLEHGEVLARLGSWPNSTWDALSQAAIAAPLNGDFLWLLGLHALQCGHSAEAMAALDLPAAAIECFTLAIKWSPDLGEPFFYRGNTLYQLGRWEPAIDDYRQAIARLPALMQAHNNLGKPTWILLAVQSDWRWLLDREDSP
jgi:tetratricopeptide (TPR) repeat protein